MNDYEIKMELWRREADPNCGDCYGRGHIMRIIPAPINVTNKTVGRMIDRCGCRKKKDKRSFAEKINAGDLEMRNK